jgi:hypothetical protein
VIELELPRRHTQALLSDRSRLARPVAKWNAVSICRFPYLIKITYSERGGRGGRGPTEERMLDPMRPRHGDYFCDEERLNKQQKILR